MKQSPRPRERSSRAEKRVIFLAGSGFGAILLLLLLKVGWSENLSPISAQRHPVFTGRSSAESIRAAREGGDSGQGSQFAPVTAAPSLHPEVQSSHSGASVPGGDITHPGAQSYAPLQSSSSGQGDRIDRFSESGSLLPWSSSSPVVTANPGGVMRLTAPPPVKAIDPTALGNNFQYAGQHVAVDQSSGSTEGTGIGISATYSPATSTDDGATAAQATSLKSATDRRFYFGLNYDEFQFRNKWGWAALDAARRGAKDIAAGKTDP